VKFAGLPKADLILITDSHGDHHGPGFGFKDASQSGTEIWRRQRSSRLSPRRSPIANGETKKWQGWTIEAVPAYNLKRGPEPRKILSRQGGDYGYVLTYGGARFYFSGDTEGVPECGALKNIDVAFVCMNLPYTMPPEEAADAVKSDSPKVVIPYHYRGSESSAYFKRVAKAPRD